MEFNEFIGFVDGMLPEIKQIAESYFYDKSLKTEFKADNSPVTCADREIENYITKHISECFPSHSIIGEESTDITTQDTKYKWVIDPIDGTQSFIHGVPLFSTLIALMSDNKPLFGAIYLPIIGDVLYGDGHKSLLNGTQKVFIKETDSIEDSTILTSGIKHIVELRDKDHFDNLVKRCRCFRTWGDGFGYFLLATGKADAMIDAKMQIWDIMALIPIIKGAGGVITDYYGQDPAKGDSIIAAHPNIHNNLICK